MSLVIAKFASEPAGTQVNLAIGKRYSRPRWRSVCAALFTRGGALGNLVYSSLKDEQAASFWPRRCSDMASLSRLSGRFFALGVVLVALQEGVGGSAILAAHEQRFAHPVEGVTGQRIVRILAQEILECGFRGAVVALDQIAVGRTVQRLRIGVASALELRLRVDLPPARHPCPRRH